MGDGVPNLSEQNYWSRLKSRSACEIASMRHCVNIVSHPCVPDIIFQPILLFSSQLQILMRISLVVNSGNTMWTTRPNTFPMCGVTFLNNDCLFCTLLRRD